MTPADFFRANLENARRVSARTGIDPRLVLAQTALETGYGESAPNNNLFGIKGQGSTQQTKEFRNGQMQSESANFRSYEDPAQSFDDYADLMLGSERYAGVLGAKGLENQISAMAQSGYATDPNYGQKLMSIASGIDLNSAGTIADDTMRAIGKSPKGILAPTQTSETETKPMMQPKQKPRGLLSGLLGDEDKRARLAMALEGMTLNPNRGLMAAMQGGIEQRRDDKLAATEADKTEAQRNSTGKWLMENGFKEIGAGVLSGAISGSAGLQMSQKAGNTKDTALIRNALAAGYKPGTPEYQRFIASGGDIFSQEAAIRANLPKPESGMAYEFEKDERGNIVGYKLVPIEGGKADRNAQKTKEGEDTVLTTAGLVLDNINSIQDMLKNSKLPIAGLTGNMLQKVPGTSAYDVSALAATIKANIGFDRLQRMRMESPTGGALGNVSNQELTSLQATLGNLDQAQSQQQFADQLQDIEAQYLAILNKFNEYPEDVRAKVGYTKTKISEAPTGSTQEIEAEDGVYTIKQKP